jgi:hypothetical protein
VVGHDRRIQITDCARIALQSDEQVTFTTPSGGEYDVARKSWGFYATPSTNARLPQFGLRAVLVRNQQNRHYVFLVEKGFEADFEAYLRDEKNFVVAWLDDERSLVRIAEAFGSGGGT